MLFNSYTFIFAFLPIALSGFFLTATIGRTIACVWLVAVSLVFYGWWDPRFVPLLLISIAVNYGVATMLLRGTNLSHAGLALSTSAVAIFGAVALFAILRARIGGVYGRNLASSVWRITLASAVMGVAVWLSSHFIKDWIGIARLGRLVDLAVSIPIGLLIFYAACRLLRVSELDLATRALAGPLRRLGLPTDSSTQ